ncbi:hypothetical protein CR47_0213935 [Ralstonia solanacearum]|nr:hypothetical protein [Ralstonia solanacearum]KEI31302.1 hypothetical protein CQ06_23315 [Ralstonia solanacearum]KFZ93606.1 hypothetical protein CR47_0213935 [Ralstonia solanacearum]
MLGLGSDASAGFHYKFSHATLEDVCQLDQARDSHRGDASLKTRIALCAKVHAMCHFLLGEVEGFTFLGYQTANYLIQLNLAAHGISISVKII